MQVDVCWILVHLSGDVLLKTCSVSNVAEEGVWFEEVKVRLEDCTVSKCGSEGLLIRGVDCEVKAHH